MRAILKAFLLLLALFALLAAVTVGWIGSGGISARTEPGRVETAVARTMRRLAIPQAARNRANPVTLTPDVLAEGMAHYADHCAACHANDGSGNTEMGRGLYPRAPDMRLQVTQNLSDGVLFYIIENGVRLTGMPAWSTGTPEGEAASWHLVHFIRRLPHLTDEEIARMEQLNPQSPEETRRKIDEERFLRGDDVASVPQRSTTHQHTGAAQ